MKFILCVLWSFAWCGLSAQFGVRRKTGFRELYGSKVNTTNKPAEDWITQKLDHFNPSDNRTWQQRFQIHFDYYKEGGPVFFLIGGEGSIDPSTLYFGTWIDYAKELQAVCVQLEHRYYGLSRPTEDLSITNLAYLTVEQALADISEFIVAMQNHGALKYSFPKSAKVITFGGSYGGTLSAWMRLKYPKLVHAAVSSSAPLLSVVDFYEYYNVVESALSAYNPECVAQIKQANEILNSLLNNNTKAIEEKFKLCETLDSSNKKDVANMFELLAEKFAYVVQYRDNYRLDHRPQNMMSIEHLCNIMVNKSIPSLLDRYAEVSNVVSNSYGDTCFDVSYTKMLSKMYLDTSWRNIHTDRPWLYQTCTELGSYQTSKQQSHTFTSYFPVEFYIDMCIESFGKSYDLPFVNAGAERTNKIYGGLGITASRVVYVNGDIDPWHVISVTNTKVTNSKAILIKGGSHGADSFSADNTDPPQLTEARKTVKEFLKQWLMENGDN